MRARVNAVAWFNVGQIAKFRAGSLAGEVEDLQKKRDEYRKDPRAVK